MNDRRAPLLDLDPELGHLLDEARYRQARQELIVQLHALSPGPWDAERLRAAGPEHVGLLVVDALLVREVALADNVACELLGPGDLIRPWHCLDPARLLRAQVRWTVLDPGRLAVLDRRFAAQLARFPEINAIVLDRMSERAQRLATSKAISQLNGVDRRLLALFWHLAERWGRVVPGGIAVTLPLPHRLIAELVGARRPTVSTALGALADQGVLVRAGETWLLTGDPVGLPTGEAARVIHARRRRSGREGPALLGPPAAASVPNAGVRQTVGS
jgi:CRP/FNR family transcriptional regulator, cyclic AMP receptor protein